MPPISRRSAPPPPTAPSSSSATSGYADVSELGNYTLDSNIGKGSFGVISKVIRKSDGQEFAMKQIDYGKMTDKDKKQILAEVAILESLKHRNIVQLVQKIRDRQNERIYIVMEYCTSGDLGGLIRRAQRSKVPMNEEKIWNIFLQITLALNHCHWPNERTSEQNGRLSSRLSGTGDNGSNGRYQVLHRDLKPENVFMSDEFVKLGDFGLSKDMGTAAFTSTYVGTPLYMPPEILAENRYDTKSDIWSLGCLVFEMCVLSSPFSAATTQAELIGLVRSGRLPEIPAHYSQALRTVIRVMLNLNPAKRPTTKDLLELDEMKLHKKLFTIQNHTRLLNVRQEECKRSEEANRARHVQLDLREKGIVKREADLLLREQACTVKEADLSASNHKLAAAAENMRAQWDQFNKERAEVEQAFKVAQEQLANAQVQAESARTAANPVRPALEERATMPVASGSRPGAVPSVYENTPTKIPLPSAAPLSLRKHASKSLGNLAAIARGDIGPSMPLTSANPSFPGNLYHNPIELDRTPAKQVAGGSSSIRSRKDRFGRNSIGSPGDLKQKYMHIGEDITMASANGGHYISPAMFRQNAAVAGLDDGDIGDNSAMASPFLLSKGPYGGRPRKSSLVGQGGISGLRQAAASASNSGAGQTPAEVLAQQRQQIQAPAPVSAASSASASTHSAHSAPTSYALEKRQATNDAVQATPAKWSPDDPDLPSPFLRRMTTAPAVVTTTAPSNGTVGSAASVPAQHHSQPFRSARERLALGPISVPNATAAGAIADVASGVSKLGIRPKSSAPPGTTGMSAIPRSKSGNLHQYALNRAASEEKVAKTGPVSGAGAGVGSMGYARSRTNGRG